MNSHLASECGCDEFRSLERRDFLVSTAGKLGALAMLSAPAWLPKMAFAFDPPTSRDLIVRVILRGGADGLTLCVPHGDPDYYEARPVLAIPPPDSISGPRAIDLDGFFGLPPAMAPLKALYDAEELAIIHAVGQGGITRSHFQAQDAIEVGSANIIYSSTGWLARHLLSMENPSDIRLRAISTSIEAPRALNGAPKTIALPDIDQYGLAGRPLTASDRQELLSNVYQHASQNFSPAAANTIATIDLVEQIRQLGYTPANGAVYGWSQFEQGLRTVAQVFKADVGLEVACIEFGGSWDFHTTQGNLDGGMKANMDHLTAGLLAFRADLGADFDRVTIVINSEFGRRVAENGSNGDEGTDHGHGGIMLVAGGHVNGGQVYTNWPGLHPDVLYENIDVPITIDSRDILAEILYKRAGNANLASVFPEYTPTFRNVVY